MSLSSAIPKALRRLQNARLGDPHSLWQQAHLSRRAGVLLLLSPARRPSLEGSIDVLLTVRSQQLSYAGDAALPGGKADNEDETPWEVAVREAQEEVGLAPSQFEFIKTMPAYVSSRMLMVVPSVAWAPEPIDPTIVSAAEVDKVFCAHLHRFLHSDRATDAATSEGTLKLHHFDLPAVQIRPSDPKFDRVWGLTANILIDCARLCYGEEPNFDFYRGDRKFAGSNTPVGNMNILESMLKRGKLGTEVRKRRPSA